VLTNFKASTFSAGQENSYILQNLKFHYCFNDSLHLGPILSHICGPTRTMAFTFLRFLDHTQRHTTLCGTPLDEWSSRRTYLYLTTHNTHKRQTFMPQTKFEPVIPARSRDHRDRHFSNINFNITFASTNTLPTWGSYFEVSKSIFVHFLPLSRRYTLRSSDPPLFYLYK
jgi:hypothetical protein